MIAFGIGLFIIIINSVVLLQAEEMGPSLSEVFLQFSLVASFLTYLSGTLKNKSIVGPPQLILSCIMFSLQSSISLFSSFVCLQFYLPRFPLTISLWLFYNFSELFLIL